MTAIHAQSPPAARMPQAARVLSNRSGGVARLSVSETGGAYNSGQDGVTNAFVSGFWWNDLLGALSKHGHAFACRQSLVGGRYALLDLRSGQPSPDFYSTWLWRTLMSPKALRVVRWSTRLRNASVPARAPNASAGPRRAPPPPPPAPDATPLLRAYAHCARSSTPLLNERGGVSVLMLNLGEDAASITVELPGADEEGGLARIDYVLTADTLGSRSVRLNAKRLRALPNGSLPLLQGTRARGRRLSLPPLSFGVGTSLGSS